MNNQNIATILAEFSVLYKTLGDTYRYQAYQNAVRIVVQSAPITIDNVAMLRGMGVGANIIGRIVEYLTTGQIAELGQLRQRAVAYRELMGIRGVGPKTITRWIGLGIQSLVDLRYAIAAKKIVLTTEQKYGLRYYTDLNTRIPRSEVTATASRFKNIFMQIEPAMLFSITGSYRRGLDTSGDIDILICADTLLRLPVLKQFITRIQDDPGYIDTVSMGPTMTTFLYKYGTCVRQVDILSIGRDSYYAALMYFTGDAEFAQAMRSWAKMRGYRLNQAGLYKYTDRGLKLIPTHSEREIFDILGLMYVEPVNRNRAAIVAKK